MKFSALLLCIAALHAQPNAPSDSASVAAGEKLYHFHCAFCHGRGDDGFAANLVQHHLRYAPSDLALVNIIRNGIPGTDMPAALGMTDQEIWKLAGFVRKLGRSGGQNVSGNVVQGEALYKGKGGCGNCHMVNGAGGRMGPDLTAIGAVRSPSNLRTSLVEPDAALAAGFIQTKATLKNGSTISGMRLNEDTFSIQIRDMRGRIQSLQKADITKLEKNLTKSAMPTYKGRLNETELDDIVAYLYSLKGGM